jgi:hypothetical protein
LTDDDVAVLRGRVSAGEKPRVIVRTASAAVPAGTRGNVVRVGNPKDGEFIVVRLGRDEVPFAPSELGLAVRGKAAIAPAPAKAATRAPAQPAKSPTKAAAKAPAGTTAKAAANRPAAATSGSASKATTARRTTAKRTTGRGRRSPQPLTVTLRFANDVWTVEAQRGKRRLAKASQVRPGAVKAFADLVDEPAVREALSETVATSRAVVEERAQKLRAELGAAEAALREYEARRR